MVIFKVVKEEYGWTIRTGDCMSAPFWSRDTAVREANLLADAIRRHGERVRVIVQDPRPGWMASSDPGQPTASRHGERG
jgi:alpha-beta hydrolase superfamily lysophospholipase